MVAHGGRRTAREVGEAAAASPERAPARLDCARPRPESPPDERDRERPARGAPLRATRVLPRPEPRGAPLGARPREELALKTRQEILDVLRRARPELTREYGLWRLALFGSYARGDARPDSDVDVLVEFDPCLGLRFVDLADRIEALIGIPTDVVSRRSISPRHWSAIEQELIDVP